MYKIVDVKYEVSERLVTVASFDNGATIEHIDEGQSTDRFEIRMNGRRMLGATKFWRTQNGAMAHLKKMGLA